MNIDGTRRANQRTPTFTETVWNLQIRGSVFQVLQFLQIQNRLASAHSTAISNDVFLWPCKNVPLNSRIFCTCAECREEVGLSILEVSTVNLSTLDRL
jgi:hypothetical protein